MKSDDFGDFELLERGKFPLSYGPRAHPPTRITNLQKCEQYTGTREEKTKKRLGVYASDAVLIIVHSTVVWLITWPCTCGASKMS